jgi:phosphatidylserine synthase
MANAVFGIIAMTFFIDGRGGDVGKITIGCCLLFISMACDGLDGMIARKLGSKHSYGTYLDSVSDMFSFCIAPGVLIYCA